MERIILGDDISVTYKEYPNGKRMIFVLQGKDFNDTSKKIWFGNDDIADFGKKLEIVLSGEKFEAAVLGSFIQLYRIGTNIYIEVSGFERDRIHSNPLAKIIMGQNTALDLLNFINDRIPLVS